MSDSLVPWITNVCSTGADEIADAAEPTMATLHCAEVMPLGSAQAKKTRRIAPNLSFGARVRDGRIVVNRTLDPT